MPSRFGCGELYGFDFSALAPERVRELSSAPYKSLVCPFKPVQSGKPVAKCNKKGGVCSLRQFVQDEQGTISRWGKKMAVVINRAFWNSPGEMRPAMELSKYETVFGLLIRLRRGSTIAAVSRKNGAGIPLEISRLLGFTTGTHSH
jgi:hypothetical protein